MVNSSCQTQAESAELNHEPGPGKNPGTFIKQPPQNYTVVILQCIKRTQTYELRYAILTKKYHYIPHSYVAPAVNATVSQRRQTIFKRCMNSMLINAGPCIISMIIYDRLLMEAIFFLKFRRVKLYRKKDHWNYHCVLLDVVWPICICLWFIF